MSTATANSYKTTKPTHSSTLTTSKQLNAQDMLSSLRGEYAKLALERQQLIDRSTYANFHLQQLRRDALQGNCYSDSSSDSGDEYDEEFKDASYHFAMIERLQQYQMETALDREKVEKRMKEIQEALKEAGCN